MDNAVIAGFRNVRRFSGRTSRGQFWPYCGAVIGLAFLANSLLFAVVIGSVAASDDPTIGPQPFVLVAGVFAWVLGAAGLLAAAVVRRLHDIGKSGYLGLLPLPFLVSGLSMMVWVMSSFEESADGDLAPFFVLFANNIAYLATLGWLVFLLVRRGDPQDNRFGSVPT